MSERKYDVQSRLAEIEKRVMDGLTPFQKATVEHVAGRYEAGQMRVLVADEVGLGKTLIARGVIAKMARLRSEEHDDLVKVVYVCSNASIAAQNVSKLKIDGDIQLAPADSSRLSMQHLKLAQEKGDEKLRSQYIQITPLTPGTSFSISSGTGTMHERALILAVLAYDERLASRLKRLARLMWDRRANSNPWWWQEICKGKRREVAEAREADPETDPSKRYPFDVLSKVEAELSGETTIQSICDYLDSGAEDRQHERLIINDLRRAFAKACIDMLNPDFVIMDEFQRFRSLIADDDSETSLLAKRFFAGETRVLLLSATPFRMYSTDAELDTEGFENSYQEFLEVMGFLGGGNAKAKERFSETWGDYMLSLRSLGSGACDIVSVHKAKEVAEGVARGFMARTERQSTHELGAIVDNRTHVRDLDISKEDVIAFMRMRRIADDAGISRSLMSTDFVKSCPFPLSFMSDYKFFKELEAASEKRPSLISANKRADAGLLWLRKWDVSYYEHVKVGNARYKALVEDLNGDGSVRPEQLLWVPASRPYYKPDARSPYANAKDFSKMILFSSWAMVPPSLSCLLSYEFERKNVQRLRRATGREYRYFKDEEARGDEQSDSQALPYRRMRFDRDQRNAFLLLYPSRYLARLINVNELASSEMSLAELKRKLRKTVAEDLLKALGLEELPSGMSGPRASIDWYVMSAIRLDAMDGEDVLGELLGDEAHEKLGFDTAYQGVRQGLERIAEERESWNPFSAERFPADLVDVLVDAAIASPAVCALRTYGAYAERVPAWMGFQFGHAFVSRMNTASATLTVAAVMEGKDDASAHWKNLLDYSCEGNLQAVLDEYAYLQRSVNISSSPNEIIESMHRAMVGLGDEPDLRNVEAVHVIRVPNQANAKTRIGTMRMRTNIASAFMDSKSRSTGDAAVSRSNLREAFNSPFRPFVLVSTSVGQEGLDFHQYCRKICHWNLPGNPIDLEQREGRVNRYQGLSVRQSVAARYGGMQFGDGPIWEQIFSVAEERELEIEGEEKSSGLLPNWGVTEGESLVPVERYAYLYPFSKDRSQYDSLIEQVFRYRMVIGQPDQEELLRMLRVGVDEGWLSEDGLSELYVNLCPYVWKGEGEKP